MLVKTWRDGLQAGSHWLPLPLEFLWKDPLWEPLGALVSIPFGEFVPFACVELAGLYL